METEKKPATVEDLLREYEQEIAAQTHWEAEIERLRDAIRGSRNRLDSIRSEIGEVLAAQGIAPNDCRAVVVDGAVYTLAIYTGDVPEAAIRRYKSLDIVF